MNIKLRSQLYLTLITIALCLPRAGGAEPKPETELPSANDVIARYVKAVGGKAAFEKIESQKMVGTFEMQAQGLRGKLVAYGKRPDKLHIRISIPGIGDMLQGYDGTVGWAMTAVTGPMLLEGAMLEQVKEQAQFDSMMHNEADFKSMETEAVTEFGGKECYKLKLVRKSGREVTEFYDKKTGLLVGTTEVQESPLGPVAVTSLAEEYKQFDKLLLATKLTQKIGPLTQVITVSEVEFNTVDDSVFELPEQVKALVSSSSK
jgi:zinc protease